MIEYVLICTPSLSASNLALDEGLTWKPSLGVSFNLPGNAQVGFDLTGSGGKDFFGIVDAAVGNSK